MNVTEAAYRLVSGRFSLVGEARLGRGELMDAIEAKLGGSQEAAGALGVSVRTWQRWRSGQVKKMKPANARALRLAVRRIRLSPGRERRLRAAGAAFDAPTLVVTGDFRVSNEVREGKVAPIGKYLSTEFDRLGPLVDAFLAGDDDKMTEAFQAASNDYQAGEWLNITKVEF